VQEHDKVGLISNNRVEWVTIACAAYSLNANVVPMYEAQLPSDWTYILNDSGAKVVFCATTDIYDVVRSQVRINVPTLQANVCLDAPDGEPFAYSTLMHHATADVDGQFVKLPTPDDLANLIYTSGTTGTSMQTHTRLRPCDHTVPPITVFLTFPCFLW
jgi:long-chain acyl-CoA synthetase